MTVRVTGVRYKPNEKVIARVVESAAVQDGTLKVADGIAADVKASTSSSRRLHQYGKKMVTDNTDTGARAGTTWGPAVPVEFGTFRTPPLRILVNAASKHGKVKT